MKDFFRVYSSKSPDFSKNIEPVDFDRSSFPVKNTHSQGCNNSDGDQDSFSSGPSIFIDKEFKLDCSDSTNKESINKKSHKPSTIPVLNDYTNNYIHLSIYSYNNKSITIKVKNKSNNPFIKYNKFGYVQHTTLTPSKNKFTKHNWSTTPTLKACSREEYVSESIKKQKMHTSCQSFPIIRHMKKRKEYFTNPVLTSSLSKPASKHSIDHNGKVSKYIKEQKECPSSTHNTQSKNNKVRKDSRSLLPEIRTMEMTSLDTFIKDLPNPMDKKRSSIKGIHFLDKPMKKGQCIITRRKNSPLECFVCAKPGRLFHCYSCSKLAHPCCAGKKRMPDKWVCDECSAKEIIPFVEESPKG